MKTFTTRERSPKNAPNVLHPSIHRRTRKKKKEKKETLKFLPCSVNATFTFREHTVLFHRADSLSEGNGAKRNRKAKESWKMVARDGPVNPTIFSRPAPNR